MTLAAARRRAGRRRLLGVLFAGYLLVLAFFLLAPTSTTPSGLFDLVARAADAVGLPNGLVTSGRVEVAANVAVFVPALAAAAVLRPRMSWLALVTTGFAASLTVELVQAAFLSARWATATDVLANTLGAALGAATGVWLRGRTHPAARSVALE